MPRDKDLKRVIRARMQKTGESYTTARAHILRKQKHSASPAPAAETASVDLTTAAAETASADLATLAGMSDATIEAKTGRTWAAWVDVLDAEGAASLPHREIAALVLGKYGVADWWAQTVTVGYERIRGLRERGQRRDGAYEAAKSRTFGVDVATLFRACADDSTRVRWLDEVRVRTASAPRSMRLDWPDGSRVVFWFTAKGDAKSSLSVQHERLPDSASIDRMKQYWGERLAALAEVLARP